jgi:hypothetical protein
MTNLIDLKAGKLFAFNTVLAGVVSAEDAERTLKDASLRARLLAAVAAVFAPLFEVFVDFSKSIADLIAAGNYDKMYGAENAIHFPTDGEGTAETEGFYFCLNRNATDQEILDETERLGCRMFTLREFLAFGIKYPNECRKHPIATINPQAGSVGCLWGAVLYEGRSERYLDLGWSGPRDARRGYSQFLIARKK